MRRAGIGIFAAFVAAAVLLPGGLPAASGSGTGSGTAHAIDPGAATDTDGVPQATCFWFGPMSAEDPKTNLAYPDQGAIYWGARFRIPPGAVLRLHGRFPHARYMSFNSYGLVEGVEHSAVDSIEDTQIRPRPGNTNPFRRGALRYAPQRNYRITIPAAGEHPGGPNVLEVPPTNAGAVQELIYRVYLPDRPRDRSARSLPRPVLTLADGTTVRDSAMCAAINDAQRYFTLQTMPPAVYTSLVNTPGADPATNPSFVPVRWEKFLNQPLALSIYRLGTPSQDDRLADLALGAVGGYYDNRDVKYSVGPISGARGAVLVLRGKLPTTPRTGPGVRIMGAGQLRYWSICQNGSPVETNVIDCVSDSDLRSVLDRHRRYTIVVSTRADRPGNARPRCDVVWLNWGTQRDILGRQAGTLLQRNLDADPDFPHSLQRVGVDDVDVTSIANVGQKRVMRAYQPVGRYTSRAAFEDRGCLGRGSGQG